jgi:hypothetical protein
MFYVGTAIAPPVAEQVWNALETDLLANAASAHFDAQIGSLCQGVIQL